MATAIVSQSVRSSVTYPVQSEASSPRPHASVYEIVTEQVIRQLESGVAPWRKPWRTELPCNLVSGKAYRGLNVFLLAPQGYGSRYWLTMNQANKLCCEILKGERSSIITYWKIGKERTTSDANGREHTSKPFLLRYYRVWNVMQSDLAGKLGITGTSERTPSIDECERIVAGMPNPPRIIQDGRAWYRPSTDSIGIPARSAFNPAEYFFPTMFHPILHSPGPHT